MTNAAHVSREPAAPIGIEALKPNPALQPLSFLLGVWRTEGAHPEVEGKIFHGRTSFSWDQGGAFLKMQSEIDEPEIPSGVAFFASDNGAERYFMVYFDERGISRKYDVELGPRAITCRRDDPQFAQCMTIRASADGGTLFSEGRMSKEGGSWQDDLRLTYTKETDAL